MKNLKYLNINIFLFIILTSQLVIAVESFCPGGSSPNPNVLFCEDWDNGSPPANFPDAQGSSFNGWTVKSDNRPDGHGYMDTQTVHSGTRSLHQVREANGNFVPDLEKTFSPTSQIRVRFYIYFKGPFGNYGADGESYIHLIFFNTNASFTGQRLDIMPWTNKTGSLNAPYIYTWPPTCVTNSGPGQNGYFVIDSPGSSPGAPFKGVTQTRSDLCFNIRDHYNEWIMVEFAHDSVNRVASMWINGNQVMNNEALPAQVGFENYQSIILSGYWSTVSSTQADFYMDDIVVSKSYNTMIGPRLAGGTNPTIKPKAPTNLRFLGS